MRRISSLKSLDHLKNHSAGIAMISIMCIIYFTVAITTLHFLRPDYNPISEPTSRYAVGQFGFLMSLAFFSMSLGSFLLVYGLLQKLTKLAQSKTAIIFLGIWVLGPLIAMIFPIDLEGAPPTLHGTIHQIDGPLNFLSFTLGVFLITRRFKLDEKWKSIYFSGLILSMLMILLFIVTFVNFAADLGFIGLFQRIYLILFVAWFIMTAIRIRTISLESTPALT
jgi:hypothetical protein